MSGPAVCFSPHASGLPLPSGLVDSGLYGLGEVGEYTIPGYSGFKGLFPKNYRFS